MQQDYLRRGAYDAVAEWLEGNISNTIARAQVWNAVNVALDQYENNWIQHTESRPGYVVMLGDRPVVAVNTLKQARLQRRLARRFYPARGYRIAKITLAVD